MSETSIATVPESQQLEKPNLEVAGRFLEALMGDLSKPICFQTFADNKTESSGQLTSCFHATWEQAQEKLCRLNAKGAGIFVTVNTLAPGAPRKSENITGLRALFIDQDGLRELPESWPITPSIIVRRDATHWHAYWLLKEGEITTRFKTAQKQLAKHFQSDPAVNDLPRVMRVPGFFHHKKSPVYVDLLQADSQNKTTINELLATYEAPGSNSTPSDFLKTGFNIEQFKDWAMKKPVNEGARHKTATSIAMEGCARKLEREAVQAVVKDYLGRAGKNDPKESKDIVAWVYDNDKSWDTRAKEPVSFDMMGYLEMIAETAQTDQLEAVRMVYSSAEQWGHLKCNEFALFKTELKDTLGTAIDLNQLGTIRKEAQKEFSAQRRQENISAFPDKDMILDKANPLHTAEVFIKRKYLDASSGLSRLERFSGDIWRYNGNCYDSKDREWLREQLYDFLDEAKVLQGEGVAPFKPASSSVDNVVDALNAHVFIDSTSRMPFWKDGAKAPNPSDIIAFKNGLLDIQKWIQDPNTPLIQHSPRWFSSNCLPYDYDPAAQCSTWMKCLDQWFTTPLDMDDVLGRQEYKKDTIDKFAMFVGYLLTQDTSQQKIGMLIGPPRCGKGTTGRVLMNLIGPANVVNPNLGSLAKEFGLAPCIGKQLAFVGDAHLGRSVDAVAVLDILKSISGEDGVSINRKFRDAITMRLTTRFVIAANQLEQFPDPSGAMAARLLIFNFGQSFLGQENLSLDKDLEAELPGVANWALAGLARLRKVGRLQSPKASQQLVQEFRNLSSPVASFIEEYCHPYGSVERDSLFKVWRKWCQLSGREVGSDEKFCTKLRAAVPGFQSKQEMHNFERRRIYSPISLNERGLDLLNQP